MEIKNFDDLISLGQVRRTVKLAGHEITMHTLSTLEYGKMTERLSDDLPNQSKRFEVLQREVLCAAVDSIDGLKPSYEEKVRLFGMLQLGFSNMLYSEYSSMVDEQGSLLDEVKKNTSPVTTALAS